MNAFFFWVFSIGMIVSALAVILGRNPVASALCFAFSIISMAGLFVMLDAYFLAAVQVLVTAGAVMVLFLFIIMLLDITSFEKAHRQKTWLIASLILALLVVSIFAKVLNATPEGFVTQDSLKPAFHDLIANPNDHKISKSDDTHLIGELLFTKYVAPFEVTSLLILVATIGVIVLCKETAPRRPAPGAEIRQEPAVTRPRKETTLTH